MRRTRPDELNVPIHAIQKQIQPHLRQQHQPIIVSVAQQSEEYYDDGMEYIITSEDLSL